MLNRTSDLEADSQKFLLGWRGGLNIIFCPIQYKKSINEKKYIKECFDAD